MYIKSIGKFKLIERLIMNAIEALLLKNQGVSFATITTTTNPIDKTKKAQIAFKDMFPEHSAVVKVGRRQVSIGNNYQKAVNNRLEKCEKSPDFIADQQSRAWSRRLSEGLIQHKESAQLYVEYYYLSANKSVYVYQWENGTELTEQELAMVKPLFAKSSSSKKQEEAGLDADDQVKVNIVKLENVVSIKAFGQEVYA
jgi:hypothetical protein